MEPGDYFETGGLFGEPGDYFGSRGIILDMPNFIYLILRRQFAWDSASLAPAASRPPRAQPRPKRTAVEG